MDAKPFLTISSASLKKGIIILFSLMVLLGCTGDSTKKQTVMAEKYQVGETVYVCGCPMRCCSNISRDPKGRCACNFPLKPGIVSRIQNGVVYVNNSGWEKPIFTASR